MTRFLSDHSDFSSDHPTPASLHLRTLNTQKSLIRYEMVVVPLNMSTNVKGQSSREQGTEILSLMTGGNQVLKEIPILHHRAAFFF